MNNAEELVKQLVGNPWVSLFLLFLGIFSTGLSVYLYFRQKKDKRPCWRVTGQNVISNLDSEFQSVKMLFEDRPIANLTVSKVAVWNNGRETILSEDVASAEPIVIMASNNAEILEAQIIETKSNASNFSVAMVEPGSVYKLTFDYADYHDYAIVQVLHTGNRTSDISVSGSVRGAGTIREIGTSIISGKIALLIILPAFLLSIGLSIYMTDRIDLGLLLSLLWLIGFFVVMGLVEDRAMGPSETHRLIYEYRGRKRN